MTHKRKLRNLLLIHLILLLPLALLSVFAKAQSEQTSSAKKTIYKLDIKEMIAPPIWHKLKKGIEEAENKEVDYILFQMNTYGGMVDMADSIRTKILNSPIPTIVFIDNNAASAGALISIACDSIYMRESGTIGAATVVNQTGQEMPDKYQSYMRATMRATAEASGRDPLIAEGMVDDRVSIPGIIDSGEVITFTSSEAIENGFCEGIAESIDEVIKEKLGVEEYEIVELNITWVDKVIAFLVNPMVSSLLILMIFGGIYFELQTPGVGFPLLAAVIGAMLYFAPLYLQGLAENWEILLFVGGLIFIALEVFVIPGFGVAGILGITMVVVGLALSMLNNDYFDFTFTADKEVAFAFIRVVVPLMILFIALVFFGERMLQSRALKRLVLDDVQSKEEGYIIANQDSDLIGKIGIARTILRPGGKVTLEGRVFDATAAYGWIEEGTKVRVLKQERYEIIVEAVEE